MTDEAHESLPGAPARALAPRLLLPAGVAAGVFLLLLIGGNQLLNDPDTLWQVALGRWILEQNAVPRTDAFSSTFHGAPWVSTQWLAQVLLAKAHAVLGWAGPVLLTAFAAALAFALAARFLLDRLGPAPVLVLVTAGLTLAAPHLVARPHVLALPVMVAWVGALVRAADRATAPPLALLVAMALWANLHGGFVLGLALVVPLGLDAVLRAPAPARTGLALRWCAFALASVLAACATPYGIEAFQAARRILTLGPALALIDEWKPRDFSTLTEFEVCLLLGIGFALHRGLTVPPLRIALLLGLLHMALAHARNGEILGLLAPLLLAAPLARALGSAPEPAMPRAIEGTLAGATLALMLAVGLAAAAGARYAPNPAISPARAVQALERAGGGRVLNEYDFGAYLIAAAVPPFIDGRTELYGAAFVQRHYRAVTLQDVGDFLDLLDEHRIGATLLGPRVPAVGLLDRLPGWTRVYADETAVVHVRAPRAEPDDTANGLGLRR